jgi:SAM-dependent methyltransferase
VLLSLSPPAFFAASNVVSHSVSLITMQQSFFAESAAYERFMGRWSRQVAPLLVQCADIRDGQAVLDVGAGTGSLSLAAAELAPLAQITGVDPSASYVSDAQGRAPTERVRFVVGDAQALRVPDATFDRVVSLFVMNFIPDRAKALREMIRVTRTDGVIAAAVWDYGDAMQMLRVFWDEAVALDPAVAARDERNMPLCRPGELAAAWRQHGLAQVEEQPLAIRMPFPSFEDYWEPFLGGQGPAGAHVASLPAARRDTLRNRIRQRLVGNGPDRPFELDARAWAVKGVVRRGGGGRER